MSLASRFTSSSDSVLSKLEHVLRKAFCVEKSSPSVGRKRVFTFEPLEERVVLDAGPTLVGLPTEITVIAGSTYHLALDGVTDGNELDYTVVSSNVGTKSSVLEGNQSIKMHVVEENEDGTISQDFGWIIFELFEDDAPITTSRIKDLVNANFYDGLTFHRIIENFMIQGGDPSGDGTGGSGSNIVNEFSALLSHNSKGIVSMANANKEATSTTDAVQDTGDSQFFITDKPLAYLDLTSATAITGHSIFGFVTEGDTVREQINGVETDADGKPTKKVVIKSIEVFDDTENGTLRITTDASHTGTDTVTVKVKDENGVEQEYEIKVNVVAPSSIGAIEPLEMKAGTSITIDLPESAAVDYYSASRYVAASGETGSSHSGISFTVEGNKLTITATDQVSGDQWGSVIAHSIYNATTDGEWIKVFVTPAAPKVTLTGGDTGETDDGVTTSNNQDTDSQLTFTVKDVIPQATLNLYMNGVEIPFKTVSSTADAETGLYTHVIETVGKAENIWLDGTYNFQITQTQVLPSSADHSDPLVSDKSPVIALKVVTAAPVFTSPTEGFEFDAEIGKELKIPLTTDQDSNGDITYSITSSLVPAGMKISDDGKYLIWTPAEGQDGGDYNVTITATNSAGLSSNVNILVMLQSGTQFIVDGETIIDEEDTLELDLSPTEEDETEGDITYTIADSTLPEGADFTLVAGEDGRTAKFTWKTTEADGPGTYTITFVASDAEGGTRRKMVSVTIDEVNQAPTIDSITETQQATEHEEFSLVIVAKDADLPQNELTYTLVGEHEEGMEIDPATGKFTWTPTEYDGGKEFSVTVEVTDEEGLKGTTTFKIAVGETDDSPIFAPIAPSRFYDSIGTFIKRIVAEDPDIPTNTVKYTLEGDVPTGMTIDSDGIIQWSIPAGYLGQTEYQRVINVTVKATEIIAGEGEDEFTEGLSTTVTFQIEMVNKQYETQLAFQSTPEKSRSAAIALPSPPQVVSEQMMMRRQTVDTSSSVSSISNVSPLYDRRFRDYFADISFGIDDIAEFVPTTQENTPQDMEETSLENHTAFRPVASGAFLRGMSLGFLKMADPLVETTAESRSQVAQVVFDLYEASQELELAYHVQETPAQESTGKTFDRAISELVVDGTPVAPASVTPVSQEAFEAAASKVQRGTNAAKAK